MAFSDTDPFADDSARPETRLDTSAPPAIVTRAPSALALLKALRRRWLLAFTIAVLATGMAGAAAWLLLPGPAHTVRSQIYIAPDQPRVLFNTNEMRSDATSFRQTQVALLKSRLVLNAALRQSKVAELSVVRARPDAIAWLEKELKVTPASSPEILGVWLSGEQPQELVVLVNAIVAAYMQEIVNKDHVKRQSRLDHLKEIAAKYDENLRRKRRTLRELAENVGSSDKQTLAMKQLFSVEQFHLTQKELLQVRSDLRKLQTELNGQTEDAAPEIPESHYIEAMQKDAAIARYEALKSQLEDDIQEIKRTAVQGEKHPSVKRCQDEMANLDNLIARRRDQLRGQLETRLRDRTQLDHKAYGMTVQKRFDFCKRLEKQLLEDSKRLEDEAKTLNKGYIDIESSKNEIAQSEEVTRKVIEEVEKLSVELQAAPRVSVLEEAVIDGADTQIRHFRNIGLVALAALALAILAVAWCEFRSRRVETVDEVVHGLGMKLVGTLPAAARKTMKLGTKDSPRQTAFHESINAARTMLLHMARSEATRVVMVTSAVAGEGKTSLASQLASSLARAGRKTLLVDCDLRKPALHGLFDLPQAPGCCEILRAEIDVIDAVQPTSFPNLSLLPAGHCDAEVLQSLAHHGVEALFTRAREDFDFIIVDSSPVLPVADAVQVGQHVDAVVFSVLRNVSRLPRIYTASQRLTQLGVRVLGAVVLGTRTEADADGYHYAPQTQAQ